MSCFFEKYHQLQDKLEWVRWQHLGYESKEEDVVLDEMDEVWVKLTDDEKLSFKNKCSIIKKYPRSCFVDVDVSLHHGAVRRRREE